MRARPRLTRGLVACGAAACTRGAWLSQAVGGAPILGVPAGCRVWSCLLGSLSIVWHTGRGVGLICLHGGGHFVGVSGWLLWAGRVPEWGMRMPLPSLHMPRVALTATRPMVWCGWSALLCSRLALAAFSVFANVFLADRTEGQNERLSPGASGGDSEERSGVTRVGGCCCLVSGAQAQQSLRVACFGRALFLGGTLTNNAWPVGGLCMKRAAWKSVCVE